MPYPSQVFLTLFGLPLADREQLLAWKDGLLQAVDPTGGDPDPAAMDAALGLFEYVQRSVAERRHGDGNDLMTQLLQVTEEGGLTDEDVIGLSFLFVLAGLDTVTAVIGFALYHLAIDADLRPRARIRSRTGSRVRRGGAAARAPGSDASSGRDPRLHGG